ncbi:accessory factor UbiK family protein [bacterium]|nr:accessory factor UbiK family protein [bacterium]
MQTRNPMFDDMARAFSGAAGVAQAAGEEMRAVFRSQADRIVAEMDLARRDEIEALKTLAATALERVEQLEKRVAELEGRPAKGKGAVTSS